MDLRKIKKLIDLLEQSNLSELEIHEGEEVVRLSRHPVASATQPTVLVQQTPSRLPARRLSCRWERRSRPAIRWASSRR